LASLQILHIQYAKNEIDVRLIIDKMAAFLNQEARIFRGQTWLRRREKFRAFAFRAEKP
jgi:hypothetical protein